MRYFLLIFGVLVVLVVLIAGRRGDLTRNRPIQIFPDMKRQLKLRPQTANSFFANGLSSQLPPPGTIARSEPLNVGGQAVYPFEDLPVNTGRVPGTTNFVEVNPLPVTAQLLNRGQQRYEIYCTPCHGATGEGKGITQKIGAMAVVANLHDKRIVELPDGDLFNTISHGKNLMGAYGAQIAVEDRWAVVAYLRALQLSRLGAVEDLSPEVRATLK
ncbi:MAG: cytochrome c [Verrucomicrobia bacterium]|nr:cytochrome c [Verrucomicrobiota bacterium]